MRIELFKHLLREEARLHTAFYSKGNFFSFPLAIMLLSGAVTASLTGFTQRGVDLVRTGTFLIGFFFIAGMMSGTFGLQASDFLERRFGDFGRLFSAAMLLPVRLSDIFLAAAASDAAFYLGWLIVPVIGGAFVGTLVMGGAVAIFWRLLVAAAAAFAMGILLSFFLTITYNRSRTLFLAAIGLLAAAGTGLWSVMGAAAFAPQYLFLSPGLLSGTYTVVWLAVLVGLTRMSVGREYRTRMRKSKELRSRSFSGAMGAMVRKDLIDLGRSHGLIAKPLFNVVLPSALLMLLLMSLQGVTSVVTEHNTLLLFALIVGVLSIGNFNAMLSSDSMAYYSFLPVSLRRFLRAKYALSSIISVTQGAVLVVAFSLLEGSAQGLGGALATLVGVIAYTTSANILIGGLHPNENALSTSNLFAFMGLLLPVLLAMMVLPVVLGSGTWLYAAMSVALLLMAWALFEAGVRRVERRAHLTGTP